MSGPEPVTYPQDHPESAVIRAALYRAGAGAVLAGRIRIGGEPGPGGCLTVYQETKHEDMTVGLAVPYAKAAGTWAAPAAGLGSPPRPAASAPPAAGGEQSGERGNGRAARLQRP